MKKTIKITGAIVVLSDAADSVSLNTDIPDPISDGETLSLRFRAPKDGGVRFVREWFGVTPKVVNARVERIPFSRGNAAEGK